MNNQPSSADNNSLPELKPTTTEQIDRAISWYEANAKSIAAALPITTLGVTFGKGWAANTLEPKIRAWKGGKAIGLTIASAYIANPLRIIKGELI